jgi:hypothetical protein
MIACRPIVLGPLAVAAVLMPAAAGAVTALSSFVVHSTGFSFSEPDMTFGFEQSTISFALPQAEPGKALKSAILRVEYSFVGTLEWTTEQSVDAWEKEGGEEVWDNSVLYVDFPNYDHPSKPALTIFTNEFLINFALVGDCVIGEDPYIYDEDCLDSFELSYSRSDAFDGTTGWFEPESLAGYQGAGTVPVLFGIDWVTSNYVFPDFTLSGTATVIYEYAAPIPLPAGLSLALAGLSGMGVLARPWRRRVPPAG